MKICFSLLFSFFCLFSIVSKEEIETVIFEEFEESVVYITQSLYFDSKEVKERELFAIIEDKYDVEILDSHFTLSSGTGFFITNDGHIMTNHHVVDAKDIQGIRKKVYNNLIKEFFSKIPYSVLNSDDYALVKKDVKKLVENSQFEYRVFVGYSETFTANLLTSNKELDTALLKIDGNAAFKSVYMGDSDLLKVGNFIMAIGYPVPGSLFYAVKDFKSTLSQGVISAIRSDNWGIQHTSAISPGNSGGPLFNKQGEVIGINVGAVTTGNDLYFSIPMSKAISWLQTTEYFDIVQVNREQATALGKQYNLNETGELVTGPSILVNLKEGYTVSIDGLEKGKTPLLLEELPPGSHILTVESNKAYSEQKILVNNDKDEILTYTPLLKKYTGKLFINSIPSGAGVYIKGRKEGNTPLVLNKIGVGEQKVKVLLDGYFDKEESVVITRDKTAKMNITLEKGYKIVIKSALPSDTSITLIDDSNEERLFEVGDQILVKNGEYTVRLESDSFQTELFDVNIAGKDEIIDFTPEVYTSKLVLTKLNSNSKVFIDGNEVTDKLVDGTIELDLGSHRVMVETPNYEPFHKEVEIIQGEDTRIALSYNLPGVKLKKGLVRTGVVMNISGAPFIIGGAVCLAFGYEKSPENPFNQKQDLKDFDWVYYNIGDQELSNALYIAGGALLGTGVFLELLSIPFYAGAIHVSRKSMSFETGYDNGLTLAMSYKF